MKQSSENKINAIGVMSGTSLDGLDLAAVEFRYQDNNWNYKIMDADTIPYSESWKNKLKQAPLLTGEDLMQLHSEYGNYTGIQVNFFAQRSGFQADLIASHGHTVFHQPEKKFTLQMGNGAEIAAVTKITTVAYFRSLDVALGGQGAPLVPVGDKYLFSDYEYCLNLGGFSNVSFCENKKLIAFDICPVNIVLNHLANKLGFTYDKNGELGKRGKIDKELFEALNALSFYGKNPPKSLGREWVENYFFTVLDSFRISEYDKIRTVYEHIAYQISRTGTQGKLFITGGGAHNTFLIDRIKYHSALDIVIPDPLIIDFKEALIFAFLGVLRIQNRINCFSSVTGASVDSSGGVIYNSKSE